MPELDLAVFDAVATYGRPALAWEILRRNPAYRAAYATLPAPPVSGVAADTAFVAHWGLHFR